MSALNATTSTRVSVVAVIAAHALLVQCAYATFGDNFAPIAENGWTLYKSEGPPEYASVHFTSGDAVVALDFMGLNHFTTIGPVVPIVPLGRASDGEPLKFRISIDAKESPIDVDLRRIRFVEPCGPGVPRGPDGNIAAELSDAEVIHRVAPNVATSEKIAAADLARPIALKATDLILLRVLMKADRDTIARCTIRFEGVFPNHRGARVPDAVFVRMPASTIGGL